MELGSEPKLQLFKDLVHFGWQLKNDGITYWRILLDYTQPNSNLNWDQIQQRFEDCQLLFYGGATLCKESALCIKNLIQEYTEIKGSYDTEEQLKWLLSLDPSKHVYSLSHLALITVRQALGTDLPNKLKQLHTLLPVKMMREIRLDELIGNPCEQLLRETDLDVDNFDQGLCLLYISQSTLSLFDSISHPNAGKFSILEFFSLNWLPLEMVWFFEQI